MVETLSDYDIFNISTYLLRQYMFIVKINRDKCSNNLKNALIHKKMHNKNHIKIIKIP